ncbi:hypothetical protein HQ325_12370 [Rhodococcus sp. BP-349]|uniref:hypothetical protein n=1 Tax=unclassified Rhodococcus (in: high G+C Gram-positive bacteria) TaxID=192944 RepID=UPI001C9A53CF|nr:MULTISPECIES: hypothetical protein [unclassified Rhodococcus (in: high G+C Gram-positive bacteria)]MBY6539469.1 hypothetical protein [Rhodococcus sp. BP-363]MBY6544203.1 hypothetical protein [Rhodococcus sp. BP-369]MBY6563433.1 hypothetical protein [Rhodococcus sp. BP-370]MBY6577725.1 hypothetical protein [Rhodococcus sp. BP-364]MBY6587026.1 hypothetical protein [Rhodococcus sp. BP-358]
MDLFDVVRITAKRWIIFLPLALITAYFAYQTYSDVKPSYFTSVSVGLTSPSFKDAPVQSGPDQPIIQVSNGLAESGGVSLLANLLALGLGDANVRQQVVAAGGSGSYTAEVFNLPNAGQLPIVVVSAQGGSPDRVARTVEAAAGQADAVLRGLQGQAGVPDSRLVTAFPLSAVPPPSGGLPGRTRQTAGIAVAGVVGAVIASVLFDTVWTRFRRSRRPAGDVVTAADDTVPVRDDGVAVARVGDDTGGPAMDDTSRRLRRSPAAADTFRDVRIPRREPLSGRDRGQR